MGADAVGASGGAERSAAYAAEPVPNPAIAAATAIDVKRKAPSSGLTLQ